MGYGADCHLCCGVHPGPPAMVMAEMPIFVFTSLPWECNHLQGLYSRVHEGAFTELPVCAGRRRRSTKTNEPAAQRSRAAGTAPRSPQRRVPCTCPHGGFWEACRAGQGVPRGGSGAHPVPGPGWVGPHPPGGHCKNRGSLGPLGRRPWALTKLLQPSAPLGFLIVS